MNPLHIPLATLPGPVPVGCPVYHPKYGSGVLSEPDEDGEYVAVFTCHEVILDSPHVVRAIVHACNMPGVCADLTPPPLDAQGWPTRIDALPVVVDMIARAMGHPEGQSALTSNTEGTWALHTRWCDGQPRSAEHRFNPDPIRGGVWRMGGINAPVRVSDPVTALASINPTDPLAARLAAVAILNAKPWEKQ